jgi:resolvase-like protein
MTETHPQNRRFGFARVSTVGQTLDSQLEQLRAAGCTTKIFREKVTGAHNDLRELLSHAGKSTISRLTASNATESNQRTIPQKKSTRRAQDALALYGDLGEPSQ